MDFSAGEHDVICTRKINIDRGGILAKSEGICHFFRSFRVLESKYIRACSDLLLNISLSVGQS